MNAVAGVLAGFLVIGGAVALYRLGARKAADWRRAIDALKAGAPAGGEGAVLDFEKDPQSGVFRPRR